MIYNLKQKANSILNSKKVISLSLLLAVMYMLLIGAAPANAQSSIEEIKEGALKIEQSQDELAKIKDDESISPENKLELEIHIRKRIINEALSLALKEVNSVAGKLNKLSEFVEGTREYELKEEFVTELGTFVEYYRNSLEKIEDSSMTLEEIKATAKDIIKYRESVYNPAIQEMVNFSLFFYTKSSINTAKVRLDKINSDLKELESSDLLKLDAFKETISKTEALIEEAIEMNSKAGSEILALPVEEGSVEESAIIEETNENEGADSAETSEETVEIESVEIESEINELASPEEVVDTKESPLMLMVKSLNNIRSVYETFLKVSVDIREAIDS